MTMLRVATWNVNSLRIRLPQVLDWLTRAQPDMLALQETKLIDRNFPAERFWALGYQSYYAGQKTYNGVAILSKRAAEGFVTDLPGFEDPDVHDPEVWEGQVLVSPAERASLRALLALGLEDTFRLFEQAPMRFSWWDYRAGSFRRNQGLRIDLILASTPLAAGCLACWIDKRPRREEQPSDHAPVVAEFDIVL